MSTGNTGGAWLGARVGQRVWTWSATRSAQVSQYDNCAAAAVPGRIASTVSAAVKAGHGFELTAAELARVAERPKDGYWPATDERYLRSPAGMARRLGRYPGAVERAADLIDNKTFGDSATLRGLLERLGGER